VAVGFAMDILFAKGRKASLKPYGCVARYLVVKHSWRGAYKRFGARDGAAWKQIPTCHVPR
jgi:hypothetical protein